MARSPAVVSRIHRRFECRDLLQRSIIHDVARKAPSVNLATGMARVVTRRRPEDGSPGPCPPDSGRGFSFCAASGPQFRRLADGRQVRADKTRKHTNPRERQMTERGEYRFTVKEYASGAPFIAAEPAGDTLSIGQLGFDLTPGTSYDKAREIARYMNDHIEYVTLD